MPIAAVAQHTSASNRDRARSCANTSRCVGGKCPNACSNPACISKTISRSRWNKAEACVTLAIAHARAQSPVPLVHKGFRMTSVLLLGGTRLVIETPYLREDRRGRRGRRRRTRGPHGTGCYPVLETLGIADRVSPASRSEIALHVVQAASYLEAAQMLSRRGFACDVSSLVRITTATAEAST